MYVAKADEKDSDDDPFGDLNGAKVDVLEV